MQEVRKNLGEMLLESGLIDADGLKNALHRQQQWGGRLGQHMLKLGFINEVTLIKLLGRQMHIPSVDLKKIAFNELLLKRIKPEMAKKHHAIPLEEKELKGVKFLFVAMLDPGSRAAREEIAKATGDVIKPVITSDAQLEAAIEKFYEQKKWVEIPPLKEKFEAISNNDIERLYEEPAAKEPAKEEPAREDHDGKNLELLALIRVLVRDGLIDRKDYARELKHLKEQYEKEHKDAKE